jgi:ABC-type nitrate/sulfonate/bicarbonate transport system permease component
VSAPSALPAAPASAPPAVAPTTPSAVALPSGPRRSRLRWAAPILTVVFLAGWELLGRIGWIPVLFFPPPSLILATVVKMARTGDLPLHVGATLSRLLLALAWGGGAGLVLGIGMGYSTRLRTVVDPFVAALHPVPKMSLLPLIMLIFGIGWFSKALVVAVSTFFPMVLNAMAGVRQIDPNYFDVAKVYGASRGRMFWRVVLPGSLPSILVGARMAMNRALGATIALELITADTGLGSMLFFAWQTLRTEELYATIFVIAVLGYGFRWVTDFLASRLIPWQAGVTDG